MIVTFSVLLVLKNPALKIAGVSRLVHNSRSLAVIEAELEKCEIVCANCHRRRTATQQEWFVGW